MLVTNRVEWGPQRIIALYLQRWPIETFYQDGKTHLGLDEYRMRNAEAIGKHWCLVFVAYSLLHLDCLPPSPTPGSLPIKTIGEACRQQAQALMQAVILYAHERLQRGQRVEDIVGYLSPSNNRPWRDEVHLCSAKTQQASYYMMRDLVPFEATKAFG